MQSRDEKKKQAKANKDATKKAEKKQANRVGWCWDGIYCNNPECKFKHKGFSSSDTDETDCASIRGPRQHRTYSKRKNKQKEYELENYNDFETQSFSNQ